MSMSTSTTHDAVLRADTAGAADWVATAPAVTLDAGTFRRFVTTMTRRPSSTRRSAERWEPAEAMGGRLGR